MAGFGKYSKQFGEFCYNRNMERALIVAYGRNREIGTRGDLPWGRSLPADLAEFKRRTTGGSIIMGRKTFESIGKRALPDRENIVISRTPTGIPGVLTAIDLESAYALARYPVYIIGGAQVYTTALLTVDVVYATEVDGKFADADTFFPALDEAWREVSREHFPSDERNTYSFDIVEYRRSA